MQYATWLNHRINLEFSEAANEPLSSSSRAIFSIFFAAFVGCLSDSVAW